MYEHTIYSLSYKDCVYGTVVGGCKDGLYLRLENDEMAFTPFGFLPSGTVVLCTFLKKATKNRYAVVGVDTVISGDETAA